MLLAKTNLPIHLAPSTMGLRLSVSNSPGMIERHLACLGPSGFHRLAYSEWSRAGRRADARLRPWPVAQRPRFRRNRRSAVDGTIASSARTCPDAGAATGCPIRREYSFPLYLADCAALIARLDVESVDWIGTSMGALIGMMLAAQRDSPIRKLVLNDAGAFVSGEGLNRIGGYLGNDPTFESIDAMEAAVRRDNAPYGPLTDAQWRKLTIDSARKKPGGGYGLQLRSSAGRPVQGGSCRRRRSLGRLGRGPLSDAAAARRELGHRVARGRRGHDGTRAESHACRVRRDRSRASTPERRSDRRGARLSARMRRVRGTAASRACKIERRLSLSLRSLYRWRPPIGNRPCRPSCNCVTSA